MGARWASVGDPFRPLFSKYCFSTCFGEKATFFDIFFGSSTFFVDLCIFQTIFDFIVDYEVIPRFFVIIVVFNTFWRFFLIYSNFLHVLLNLPLSPSLRCYFWYFERSLNFLNFSCFLLVWLSAHKDLLCVLHAALTQPTGIYCASFWYLPHKVNCILHVSRRHHPKEFTVHLYV